MATFEQRNKDGNIVATVTVSEELLKADPGALLKSRGPKGSAAPPTPDGYELITSMDGDPDACVSDCTVHFYAKSGSFKKEAPGGLAAMRGAKPTKTEDSAK